MAWLQDLAKRLLKGAMTDEVADLALARALALQETTGKSLLITTEVVDGPKTLVGQTVILKVLAFERR